MLIKNKTVIVYDIEIFPNVFHCCCKNTETNELYKFEISERKNQLNELIDYFTKDKSNLFCGYNNHHYDDVIINYIIDFKNKLNSFPHYRICLSLFNLSTYIIKDKDEDFIKKWKYSHFFESMDLLTMMFSQKLRVGLKTMQITMHYKNVYEYEGDFNNILSVTEIDKMIEYNINDVESTTELLNKLKEEIELRLFIEKEHGINCLSMDSVKLAETFLLEEYSKRSGIPKNKIKEMRSPMDNIPLKDVILPFITYKHPKLQELLNDMKQQIVSSKERKSYENRFLIDNVVYSVGVGGIHSIHTPKIFKPNEDEYIGHADVTSMYPSFLILYKWGPKHLGDLFCEIFTDIYNERIEAKNLKQDIKNKFLKIVLNSPTGKMQQEVSWMYDPFNVFKIRINGQLVLLMLVDQLLSLGCEIIQVNTDGVVYKAKNNIKAQIDNKIKEVENITKLKFETDEYKEFYQYAINDYFGILDNNKIEEKGMFITKNKLGKGLSPLVIPKAVINYFLTKQPVSEFIKNDKNICDFLMTQAVDKKFKVIHGDTPVQRINRFYASTNGARLFKRKYDEYGEYSDTNMLTKSGVTILNKFDDTPIENRKINYHYYVSEANKIIASFVNQQLELF